MAQDLKPKDVSMMDRVEQHQTNQTNAAQADRSNVQPSSSIGGSPLKSNPSQVNETTKEQMSHAATSVSTDVLKTRSGQVVKKVFQEAYFQRDVDASRQLNQRTKVMTALRGESLAMDLKQIILPEQMGTQDHSELDSHDGVALFVQHVEQMQAINMKERIAVAQAFSVSQEQEIALQQKLQMRQQLLQRFLQLAHVPSPTIQRLLNSKGKMALLEEIVLDWDDSIFASEQELSENMLSRLKKMKRSAVGIVSRSKLSSVAHGMQDEEDDENE